jgi:uridine kinase
VGPQDQLPPSASPVRQAVIARTADRVLALQLDRIIRVGIDGVDGAGKTTFADELARALQERGRTTIRAGLDGFHHPAVIRHRLGRDSPDGFFLDSFNYAGLRDALLDPLSPGGAGAYHEAIFDYRSETPVFTLLREAPPDAVLVFDGVFLLCPELRRYWDFCVFLDVAFQISVPRLIERDPRLGPPDPEAPENRRYVEGQRRYLRECAPRERAGMVIDNADLANPRITAERAAPPG